MRPARPAERDVAGGPGPQARQAEVEDVGREPLGVDAREGGAQRGLRGAGGTSTSKTPVPSRKVARELPQVDALRVPADVAGVARHVDAVELSVRAAQPAAQPDPRAFDAGPALEVRGAFQGEVGDEHVAVDDAEVEGARQLEVGADPRDEVQLPAVDEVGARAAQARRLDAEDPVAEGQVHGGAEGQGRRLAEARIAGAKGDAPAEEPGAALRQAALERREVEVERDALVVHPQLAALDEQAADAELRGRAAAAEAQLRDVVAALGKGAHADPRADHPQLVEVEPLLPQRAQRRRGHDERDLEEGRIRRLAVPRRAGRAPRPGTGTARSARRRR